MFLDAGTIIPDGPSLKVRGSTGKDGSRNGLTGFAAVHHAFGHRGELPEEILSATDSRAFGRQESGPLRGAVVNGSLIVWLVTGHRLSRSLLVDQRTLFGRDSRCGRGTRLDRRITGDTRYVRSKTDIDGGDNPARPETGSASCSDKRHCGWI